MPEAVFVERELTARKGRKRYKLHLRVFAPVPHGAEFACSFELTGAPTPWRIPKQIYGYDSLQAFALAMQFVGWTLLQFETEHGMRIDAWQWSNIIEYVVESPLSTHDRDRINEIRTGLRAPPQTGSASHTPPAAIREPSAASRKPSAASRKPRAASRRGSR